MEKATAILFHTPPYFAEGAGDIADVLKNAEADDTVVSLLKDNIIEVPQDQSEAIGAEGMSGFPAP